MHGEALLDLSDKMYEAIPWLVSTQVIHLQLYDFLAILSKDCTIWADQGGLLIGFNVTAQCTPKCQMYFSLQFDFSKSMIYWKILFQISIYFLCENILFIFLFI